MSVMKHNSARRWMLGAVVCAVMFVLMHGQERTLFAMQPQTGKAAGGGTASVGSDAGQASGEGQVLARKGRLREIDRVGEEGPRA